MERNVCDHSISVFLSFCYFNLLDSYYSYLFLYLFICLSNLVDQRALGMSMRVERASLKQVDLVKMLFTFLFNL